LFWLAEGGRFTADRETTNAAENCCPEQSKFYHAAARKSPLFYALIVRTLSALSALSVHGTPR
jgi:hypothetical protein